MYNILVSIIALVAILWFVTFFIFNWIVYIIYCFDNDSKYISIVRETMFGKEEFEDWQIFPTIKLHFSSSTGIYFGWLKWYFVMYYRIKTEKEDELEALVRIKIEQDESKGL